MITEHMRAGLMQPCAGRTETVERVVAETAAPFVATEGEGASMGRIEVGHAAGGKRNSAPPRRSTGHATGRADGVPPDAAASGQRAKLTHARDEMQAMVLRLPEIREEVSDLAAQIDETDAERLALGRPAGERRA